MYRQSGGALEVVESGFALPIYTSFTVAYGSTTVTYTFVNRARTVAVVVLTYTDNSYGTLTAGSITNTAL